MTADRIAQLSNEIAAELIRRGERVAVGESSAGGLISAALLAVPGASAYYLGGSVLYTRRAVKAMLDLPDGLPSGVRSSSEPYAQLVAGQIKSRFRADWAIAESGAAGPSGNAYGDQPGHSCVAIAGPVVLVRTIETGQGDRRKNMDLFALAALELFHQALGAV